MHPLYDAVDAVCHNPLWIVYPLDFYAWNL